MAELHRGRERRRTSADVRVDGAPAGPQLFERLDTPLPTNVVLDLERDARDHRPKWKDHSGKHDTHRESSDSIWAGTRTFLHRDGRCACGRGGCGAVRDPKEEVLTDPLGLDSLRFYHRELVRTKGVCDIESEHRKLPIPARLRSVSRASHFPRHRINGHSRLAPRREHYPHRTCTNQAYFDTRTAGFATASIQIRRDSRLTTDVPFVPGLSWGHGICSLFGRSRNSQKIQFPRWLIPALRP